MNSKSEHIHPIFGNILGREQKEALLNQTGICLWFTGLSGSGKSSLAVAVERALHQRGILTQVLDGDNIRTGLNNNLGFSEEDRLENVRRISEVNKLFVECGIVTLNCFVSPTRSIRAMARNIIGNVDFVEVYVNAPLEVCEQRDVKGLYKKARAGMINDFTGIHSAFEAPENPELEIKTDKLSIEESCQQVLDYLNNRL